MSNLPKPDSGLNTLVALYGAERAAGTSILTNTLALWFAATTYSTFAFGALHVLTTNSTPGAASPPVSQFVFYAVPYPACAFAGYHMILFGIGVVRSKSIELIEKDLISHSPHAISKQWNAIPSRIGSSAETNWTDLIKAKPAMKIIAISSYPAPYVLAGVLVVTSLHQTHKILFQDGPYTICALGYIAFGVTLAWLGVRTILHLMGVRARDLIKRCWLALKRR